MSFEHLGFEMNAKHASADFKRIKDIFLPGEPGRKYYRGYIWGIEYMVIKRIEIVKKKKGRVSTEEVKDRSLTVSHIYSFT